jgi:hypothetical protein
VCKSGFFLVQKVHGLFTGFQVEFLVKYIFILHEVLSYIDSTAERLEVNSVY